MSHPIESKSWSTWLGAIKAISKAGLTETHEAYHDMYAQTGKPIVVRPIGTFVPTPRPLTK